MDVKIEGRNITITNSPVQTIHEISLEYDFNNPEFEVVQCNTSSHMPIFVATCKIQKDSRTYILVEVYYKHALAERTCRKWFA